MKKKDCEGGSSEQMTVNGSGVGLLFGVIVGFLTDNVGFWISVGLCLGAGVGSTLKGNKEPRYEGSDAEAGEKG